MILIQPEGKFQLEDPCDFIRCWTFFYRLHHYLKSQLMEDAKFDLKKATDSVKLHSWRSVEHRASENGSIRAAPALGGLSSAVDNSVEDGFVASLEDTEREEEEVASLIDEQDEYVASNVATREESPIANDDRITQWVGESRENGLHPSVTSEGAYGFMRIKPAALGLATT